MTVRLTMLLVACMAAILLGFYLLGQSERQTVGKKKYTVMTIFGAYTGLTGVQYHAQSITLTKAGCELIVSGNYIIMEEGKR